MLQNIVNNETDKNGHNEEICDELEDHKVPSEVGSVILFTQDKHVCEVDPIVVDNVDIKSQNTGWKIVEINEDVVLWEVLFGLNLEQGWSLVTDPPSEEIDSDGSKNQENNGEHTEEGFQERNDLEEDFECQTDLLESTEVNDQSGEFKHTA